MPDDVRSKTKVGPLGVAIVVDQFAAWIALERLPALPASGGFARLRREGTWYQDVRFAHSITETAPGHASLFSGKVPREHGIVANELSVEGRTKGVLIDKLSRFVTSGGTQEGIGSSSMALQSEVVADRFKAQFPTGKAYSFSMKDRGAIFGGGRHPDLVLWYDASQGELVTSTAFAQRLPNWVLPAIEPKAIQVRAQVPWTMLEPQWILSHALTQDNQSGESDYSGYGTVFVHHVVNSSKAGAAFRAHPGSDRLLLELGLLALDNTPAQDPVLLAISLSANDYIGHLFGPDSWEAWDELLRLDGSLAWFFSELDRRKGSEHWSAVLSADHGVSPLPEVNARLTSQLTDSRLWNQRPRHVTERVLPTALANVAREAAARAMGKENWIEALVNPYLYLSGTAKALDAPNATKLRDAIVSALLKERAVAKVFDVRALPATCPAVTDESLDALVCRSVQPGRGGDYFIALKPGYFFETDLVPGFGTNHGNAGLYDRSVPLLLRAPGRVDVGMVIKTPQSFELFSQQLAQVLGLHPQ